MTSEISTPANNRLIDDETEYADLLEAKENFELTDIVRNGRLQHRLAFCCGYDLSDWDGFLGLFKGLLMALGIAEGLDWEDWRDTALQRYKEDQNLKQLLSRELKAPHNMQHHCTDTHYSNPQRTAP